MSTSTTHHKTIVISDIHLGSKWSKADEVTDFLTKNTCDTLILCGDIIDGWAILRGKKERWKSQHSGFIRHILKIQDHTRIYYLKGNHDDFINRLMPLEVSNITLTDHIVYESQEKKFLVMHGDVFDNSTAELRWVSKLGDRAYSALLNINEIYNNFRLRHGRPYHSIAAGLKQMVKKSVAYTKEFEDQVSDLVKSKGCDGIICGHIHRPEIRMMGDILYLNSGDWVESLSALTENANGDWELVFYKDGKTSKSPQ